MGVCKIQHKKIYDLFQKPNIKFTKKACVLGTTLSEIINHNDRTMNVLENVFQIRVERIRSGSKSNWYQREEKFSESIFN